MSNSNINSRDGLQKSSRKDIWTLVKEAKEREKKNGGSTAGTFLSDLMEIPITETNVHMASFVIVADLSKPSETILEVEYFITRIQKRVKEILEGLEQRGSKRPKALKAFSNKKYGADHPDMNA
ncbi:hypothetical protein HDU67_005820 [Dinochytrium kinnereticum]|nr:hypothetical protein HDU67_005820 [Dinochytrium kinnereticum]